MACFSRSGVSAAHIKCQSVVYRREWLGRGGESILSICRTGTISEHRQHGKYPLDWQRGSVLSIASVGSVLSIGEPISVAPSFSVLSIGGVFAVLKLRGRRDEGLRR